MDDNPRPSKRQRTSSLSTPAIELTPLPQSALLLSLPSLLLHPPNHRNHTRSLWLSLFALRKCLTLPSIEPYEECRALTEVAEIGFKIGLADSDIESEVEKSITKALLLTQKHPSLRIYKPQITRLSACLSSYQQNPKFAQTTLKRILTSFLVPSDPPHIVYASHLAYINSLSSSSSPTDDLPQSSNFRALGAIRDLHELATKNDHRNTVGVLALVLELRDLVHNGFWNDVGILLQKVEGTLTLKFASVPVGSETTAMSPRVMSNLEKVLAIHVLIIGVIFHTYVGDNAHARTRMKNLHDMLDGGALDAFGPSGIVEIPFENPASPSLFIQVTHPRIIFAMGFLVSSVARRDPVGRKPKRKVFAAEGLVTLERDAKKEVEVPPWASLTDVREFESRMSRIKADLICELIGVSICRSEFDSAERHLAIIIAHTRTHNIFSSYCARITLHQAHLAHALGNDDRAEKCYKVAAFLSRKRMIGETKKLGVGDKDAPADHRDEDEGCEDHWVNVSARVGEIWLRIGVLSRTISSSSEVLGKSEARMDHEKENDNDESESEKQWQRELNDLRISSEEVIAECEGLGGTLQAIGAILSACLSKAFLQAKSNLRTALQLSTSAQDNHLRALILSLIASQYVHTSMEHAETVLATAEQLAAGLGASVVKGGRGGATKIRECQVIGQGGGGAGGEKVISGSTGDGVGNAHLRLWIGERSLELKRRAGNGKDASRQLIINERLREAVVGIKKRKLSEVD